MANANDKHITDRLDDHEARWFALRTKNRHEKIAAKQLLRDGIEYYLPLQQVKRVYDRKVVLRELCLLPCYIFVHITRIHERKIQVNPHVWFLKVGKNRLDIPAEDIEILRQIAGDAELEFTPYEGDDWRTGDPVELIGGSFTGLKGYYMEQQNKKKFVVALEGFGNLTGNSEALVAVVDGKYVVRPRK